MAEPDHGLYRTSRLTRADEACDDWFGALLGDDGAPRFLGGISEGARERLLTPVELKREPVREADDPEWTPYRTRTLKSSPVLPAYGLERYGLPVPRRNAEAWRHFDVTGMVGTDYGLSPSGIGTDLNLDDETASRYRSALTRRGAWLSDGACLARLVYVDGRYCPSLSKPTPAARNLSPPDFDAPGTAIREEVAGYLSRLTDGFTDELAAPADDGDTTLTSYKKLSGPDHSVGEPTSQFAINCQQGSACFAALNTARAGGVALVDVPPGQDEGVENPSPILIIDAQTRGGGAEEEEEEEGEDEEGEGGGARRGVARHPRALVVAGEGSSSSVVQFCADLESDDDESEEDVDSNDEAGGEGATAGGGASSSASASASAASVSRPRLHNGYTQIFVKSDANLTHTYMEETGGVVTPGVEGGVIEHGGGVSGDDAREVESRRPALRDTHIQTVDAHVVGDGGRYCAAVMGMGGSGRSRVHLSVALLRPDSRADVSGFVLAGGAQRTDIRTNIHHVAQGTTSRQAQRNMVGGRATSSFRGRIRVEQSAQQTDSEQLSRTVLLSDRSRIWTVPSLEIIADDVQCTHGATVSDLSEEELFYLRSRGLDRETARNMLMYAFVDEVSGAVEPAIVGDDDDEAGLRRRCIGRLQNLVPQGERAVMGDFRSV